MKKQTIKIILSIGILCLFLALTVLANQANTDSKDKYYIAVITKSTQSAFFQSVRNGANAAATEYNVEMTFSGPSTEEDPTRQNELISEAINKGADAIVFSAVDYNANAQAVTEAAKKGVKIIVIDSDVNSDKVACRIQTDNYAAGQLAGDAALMSEEEELHIGIVNCNVHTANVQSREEGFRNRVQDEERVKSMKTINVLSSTEDARDKTVLLLKENPQINVLVTFNEWTSLGVGWAIRDLGTADKTVVAFDSNPVSVGMLETGEVDALIVQNPYAMGYLGMKSAYQLLKENKSPSDMDTETTLITRENMFLPEFQKILFSFEK